MSSFGFVVVVACYLFLLVCAFLFPHHFCWYRGTFNHLVIVFVSPFHQRIDWLPEICAEQLEAVTIVQKQRNTETTTFSTSFKEQSTTFV